MFVSVKSRLPLLCNAPEKPGETSPAKFALVTSTVSPVRAFVTSALNVINVTGFNPPASHARNTAGAFGAPVSSRFCPPVRIRNWMACAEVSPFTPPITS